MRKVLSILFCAVTVLSIASCSAARKVSDIVSYDIVFDVGKATLKPESIPEITRIVALMVDNPSLKYEVQGHTDNTGSASSNMKLSQKRAQAVVDKLVSLGISADRLTAVGKGQEEPIADNSTEEGRAQNRRVVFVKQ